MWFKNYLKSQSKKGRTCLMMVHTQWVLLVVDPMADYCIKSRLDETERPM